jgi:REP element-mobilizing transposase RayT
MILFHSCRSVSDLKAHLVLTTKYRHKAITGEMLKRLHVILEDLLVKWDCKLVEFNGESDHVHLCIQQEGNGEQGTGNSEERTVPCFLLSKIRGSESPTLIYMAHINQWHAPSVGLKPTPYAVPVPRSPFPVPCYYHPDLQLSTLVGNIKSTTSRRLRQEFAEHLSRFYTKDVFWNGSYFIASCGGVTISTLKQYIEFACTAQR